MRHPLTRYAFLTALLYPSLHAAETTFSWTGGLDNWNNGSRWQTVNGTGVVPNSAEHFIKIGENANGNVAFSTPDQSATCGRLRIEQGSLLDIGAGQLQVNAGALADSPGRVAGKGEIVIHQAAPSTHSKVHFSGGDTRLDNGGESLLGGGVITLDMTDAVDSGYQCGIFGASNFTLANHDWLIHGDGIIRTPLRQRPYGVVRADHPGSILLMDEKIPLNLGSLEADGGTLHLAGSYSFGTSSLRQWLTGDPATGTIRAKNNGRVLISQRDVEGGTLENFITPSNPNGRIIGKDYVQLIGSSGQPVTIRGRVDLEDDIHVSTGVLSRLNARLKGPIHNTGELRVVGGDPLQRGYPGALSFGDAGQGCQLTGGGKVVIETFNRDYFTVNGPDIATDSLINVDNRIEMHGRYEAPLINEAAGVFMVNQPGKVLQMGISRNTTIHNRGTIAAANGGILRLGGRLVYGFAAPGEMGIRNAGGIIKAEGNGTESTSRVLFDAPGDLYGGKVVNQGGHVILGAESYYTNPAEWPRQTFHAVTFEGSSPLGEVEVLPGMNSNWFNCTLNGEARIRGGSLSLNNSNNNAAILYGNGTLRLSSGINPTTGQAHGAEILCTGNRNYENIIGPIEADLYTTCRIIGGGRIQVDKIIFMGSYGGLIASGNGEVLDLGKASSISGGVLLAENGGTLSLTPPPGGTTLPAGFASGASGIGSQILINGGQPLLANDGSSLLANDGASIVAGGAGNIVASGGGNIVAAGGGNIVAGGAGNIVAGGAGNIVAGGAGNIVASGGGNIVASGGGNLISNSLGSFSAALPQNARAPRFGSGPCVLIESGGRLAPSTTVGDFTPLNGLPGTFRITGKLQVQAGGLVQCELGGTTPDTGHDQTLVTGPVSFAGKLEIRLLGSFVSQLTPAMSFTVLTASGTLTGTPENVSDGRIPTADGLGSFRFTHTSSSYVLDDFQATPGLIETYFNFVLANTLSGQPGDDRDKDGRTDFAEYAFGTNPLVSDPAPAAQAETLYGQKWLVLRYRTRASRALAGLVLMPQRSSDLGTWSTNDLIDELDPDAAVIANTEARRARIPLPTSGRAFLRLKGVQ